MTEEIKPLRRCNFCAKPLPKITKMQRGSPPTHCKLAHRQYAAQMRYLNGLYSRLQAENSGV